MNIYIESDIVKVPCPECGVDTEHIVERLGGLPNQFTLDTLYNCECQWKMSVEKHDWLMEEAYSLGKANLMEKESRQNPLIRAVRGLLTLRGKYYFPAKYALLEPWWEWKRERREARERWERAEAEAAWQKRWGGRK